MKYILKRSLIVLLISYTLVAQGQIRNGFDLSGASIPEAEILPGGPPRDGIPAIDTPHFVPADRIDFLKPTDPVLGVVHNGVRKAYPIAILNWHEIVNDSFSGEPVVITYCPLCGSGIAYQAKVGNQVLKFAVSGLLYNSNMLLYDRQTLSLWSQLGKQAVSGAYKGHKLQAIPLLHTTWADWRNLYPDSLVLSTETGYSRDYTRSPYRGYEKSSRLYFPVTRQDKRYHPKEEVMAIEIDGQFKAYPFIELEKLTAPVHDEIGGHAITIRYDRQHRKASAFNSDGEILPTIKTYWFAWFVFHPDTEVYQAP